MRDNTLSEADGEDGKSKPPLSTRLFRWLWGRWKSHPFRVALIALLVLAGLVYLVLWLVDRLDYYVELYALVVSILGFGVAIAEIQYAETLSVETKQAVRRDRRARRQRQLSGLLTRLPSHGQLVQETYGAIATNPAKIEAFRIYSEMWRELAQKVLIHLSDFDETAPAIVTLEAAISRARETDEKILESPDELGGVATHFILAVKEVSEDLNALDERLSNLEANA